MIAGLLRNMVRDIEQAHDQHLTATTFRHRRKELPNGFEDYFGDGEGWPDQARRPVEQVEAHGQVCPILALSFLGLCN